MSSSKNTCQGISLMHIWVGHKIFITLGFYLVRS